LQARTGFCACGGVFDKARDCIESFSDLRGIGKRCRQTLRHHPRAGSGHGAVYRIEQRATPVTRKCAHQFEVTAGSLIDRHAGACALA
jgi:hypothetical protein